MRRGCQPKNISGLATPAAARHVSSFHHSGAYQSFYNGSSGLKEIEFVVHHIPHIRFQYVYCSIVCFFGIVHHAFIVASKTHPNVRKEWLSA
jgi:hypothetical protein